ncbi:flagellar basal body rod protein FlgB [Virgibacillus sp. SK37]|uniref:flagellar basal body rod protein FlgB n=1 Tax=Virgibacillus sp. SK37 TaxID=403957 RepID=UPI0004D1F19D|nr:flagellar basal body rod protein FlgB [Virgibacillus sp. SK37]AIF43765.1 flagellar basal body rod protein FlgB [Virgibacillus sp. SK37]
MSMFGGTINNLENALGYSSAKNKAISNNIANIDTPNYKAKDVAFNDVLKHNLSTLEAKRTHEKHFTFNNGDSGFRTINKNSTGYNHNGNNVDVDKEMADLAKNQIYYQSLVDRINGKFGSLQKVIRGGN